MTLENLTQEMLNWELRELRLRVTKRTKISKSTQMRNEKIQKNPKKKERKKERKKRRYKNNTDLAIESPGVELTEGLRGTHGELRGTQRGTLIGELMESSRTQGTQTTHLVIAVDLRIT